MNMNQSATPDNRESAGIGADQIEYLEGLARIRLTDEEKLRTQRDLTSILEYIEKLNELETTRRKIKRTLSSILFRPKAR